MNCPRCFGALHATAETPVVSAQSLGNGTFHLECGRARWAELARDERDEAARKHERRVAQGRALAARRAAPPLDPELGG